MFDDTIQRMKQKEVEDLRANLAGFDALPAWLAQQIATRREYLNILPSWGKKVVGLYEEIAVFEMGLEQCPARREIVVKRLAAAEASLIAMTEKETEVKHG